ncbi:hypothetical protein SAMN02745135_01422 [Caloranaerobacter azorensis DSM 13643]|uniref:Uncharacterized protein n=1 Tax=Caloranaerobacter azorensis DSM 13643 TaxID=1121264 RepID=A0A1M5UHD8_9FIRM|nr:hypothetical protein [Caloranaerobacter azorensis]SHH62236.1 hypothetical protein SAMN02745135_01422 [Caloranaerobacter azorensis DSM 13643]
MPKLVIELKQHTPLIHFQGNQHGATLRATELKPKLDKFLKKHVFKSFKEYKRYLIGDIEKIEEKEDGESNKAFDYKLKIIAKGHEQIIDLEEPYPEIFYIRKMNENTKKGKKNKKRKNIKKQAVMYDEIILEFFSFHKDLLTKIEENISRFFAVTNFGLRQNKGFGSFYLKDKKDIIADVKSVYDKFLYIKYDGKTYSDLMRYVYILYKMMKSGIKFKCKINHKSIYKKYNSFLFEYMKGKGIDNEKRMIKEEFFNESVRIKKDNQKKYYVRGLLGICNSFYFKDKERRGEINVYNKNIKRFKSPITFKIVDDYLIIIPEEIPDEIYGAEFEFKYKNESEKIEIPSKEQFNIFKFLFAFADWFNDLKIEEDNEKKSNTLRMLKGAKSKPIVKVGEQSG